MQSPQLIPDLQSSLLCDDVRQERNGKFILIGLFDAIQAQQLPLVFLRLCLVTRWCSGEGEFIQHSRILMPDQKSVLLEGSRLPVRLDRAEATVTNVEMFMNARFEKAGTYWVEVLLDDQLKIRYPLRVTCTGKESA